MINSTALNSALSETPSRDLARQCRSKASATRRVSFIEAHKKWGTFSGSLRTQKVVKKQFAQGNIGGSLSNAQKVPKSGGVSFIYSKLAKQWIANTTEVIHVK